MLSIPVARVRLYLPVPASVGEVLPWLLQVVSPPFHSVMTCKREAPVGEGGGVKEGCGWGMQGCTYSVGIVREWVPMEARGVQVWGEGGCGVQE